MTKFLALERRNNCTKNKMNNYGVSIQKIMLCFAGGGGVLRISVTGIMKDLLGFEIFDFGVFWVGKFLQVFCLVA